MRTIATTISIIVLFVANYSFSNETRMKKESVYNVTRLKQPMKIDGKWDKPQWQNIPVIDIINYMGSIPKFRPEVQAKMMFDEENIYVIFHVEDKYVRCLTKDYNGPVWEDSAVEFFFAPDSGLPNRYFNLETNCGGTPLMHYNLVPRKESKELEIGDIKKIEIAHSLPQIIDPEMSDPVTWTLEYRIPLAILEKYSGVTRPEKGVEWRANFYKIAENNSNPHYITWSVVENNKPDFHLPQFFGKLKFE
jgi:Carbohydrate-binding family 9